MKIGDLVRFVHPDFQESYGAGIVTKYVTFDTGRLEGLSVYFKDEIIKIKLESISIENLPNIFKTLKLNLEANIFSEKDLCKVKRRISLRYENKNKLIKFISENFLNKFLNNLIDNISIRFDRELNKKVLKAI